MEKRPFTWTLGKVTFRLVHGDLFAVPADAIVNSEQTNFRLAQGGPSISAQIWTRWGPQVREELDAQTKGRTLPVGTVLETGGGSYRQLFHAGFHDPHVWYDPDAEDDSDQTEHLTIIRRCTRRVLERAVALHLDSVAFPLMGTGVFGLDPRILAHGFFDEVVLFATDPALVRPLTVWLAIYDAALFEGVLEAGVQSWADRLACPHDWEFLNLGVSFLDAHEQRLARVSDPQWKAFVVTQFAELIVTYLHAVLANAASPPVRPPMVLEPDRLISFGFLVEQAKRLARQPIATGGSWTRFVADLLVRDGERQCLDRINRDRNDIAHKRAFRAFPDILADLRDFLVLAEWHRAVNAQALPHLGSLSEWILLAAPNGPNAAAQEASCTGLLERWNDKRWTYLNPITGRLFTVVAM